MAGWNAEKVAIFKAAFADFLQYVVISSKETGTGPLHLYGAQKRFLEEVFKGLENDIHFFVVLKARQLGISTIVRILIVFWAFMHEGLRVALVYDTEKNRMEARAEIAQFLDRLPESHTIPVKVHNRDLLELYNGSRVSYLVAGIKKTRGSGGLGRSLGLNCCGCTEISSWADVEGVTAFQRSLSQKFENRLYIWESTARGFNIFNQLYLDAKEDDLAKKCIFIGWWAKEDYSLPKKSALFERYGTFPPTVEEKKQIDNVRALYNQEITMEQLAWYRHEFNPNRDDDEQQESESQEILHQELPWDEEEAWITTGAGFFPNERISNEVKRVQTLRPTYWRYFMGSEFASTIVEEMPHARKAQLAVFHEPEDGAVYAIGADPAYGANEKSNLYCAQVVRCYADGVEQVAEFAAPNIMTYQFAWVLAHLCGVYGNARLLLELNGPGHAVWNAFRELELLIKTGYLKDDAAAGGFKNIFTNVKNYLWVRQDSLARNPSAFHWETSQKRKVLIFERMRDFFNVGELRINSQALLDEMPKIERDGDEIRASGMYHDDRSIAMALAVRAWEDGERRALISQSRTRDNEMRRRQASAVELQQMFSESIVANFFNEQKRNRLFQSRQMRRGNRYNF